MEGIVGYGAYIPRYRIKSEEIANVWGEDPVRISKGLGILEKSVPAVDEDATTMAVEASRDAIRRAGIEPSKIGALYVGSESHPYAVKPTSSIVAQAIMAIPDLTAADLEFACKAGTAGLQAALGLVKSKLIDYGLAIGSDTAQGRPGDALEYSAAAGSAAYIVGRDNVIAEIEDTYSYTTDTPDFWRRPKADYPSHGGRFTGDPGYFKHLGGGLKGILEKTGRKISEYKYVVLHQPNAKFPRRMAKKMGITSEQLEPGLLVPVIGNTYSAAAMLGLAAVLDIAEPDDLILVVSFGSGAGSDGFSIKVTDRILEVKNKGRLVKDMINNKRYINYALYAKLRGKLKV